MQKTDLQRGLKTVTFGTANLATQKHPWQKYEAQRIQGHGVKKHLISANKSN